MLRRTGFKSKAALREVRDPDRVRPTPTPSAAFRLGVPIASQAAAIEKEKAIQHEPYMRLVRNMPCARCGKFPPSQFCHADMGKGAGIKTDCRRGFPGCPECHVLLGSSGKIPREQRRELEAFYGGQTRERVIAAGLWPASLPAWP